MKGRRWLATEKEKEGEKEVKKKEGVKKIKEEI